MKKPPTGEIAAPMNGTHVEAGSGLPQNGPVDGAACRATAPAPAIARPIEAATTMLRNGVSLQDIGTVLRHRSLHTTLHYAKVDTALLQVVVNPWPEVAS